MRRIVILLLSLLILSNLSKVFSQTSSKENNDSKIVSVEWLANHINDSDLVILHVAPLRLEYTREHIPSARFLWTGWLTHSTTEESNVPMPVTDIKKTLESLGISNKSKIVLTFMNGLIASTCRVFLTLDYIGLGDQTYILSGGLDEWKAMGKTVTTEIPKYQKAKLKVKLNQDIFYDSNWVLQNLKTSNLVFVDARAPQIYEGKIGTPRAGHIPGAKNLPLAKLYDDKTYKFLLDEKLIEEFKKIGVADGKKIITYCATGNAASMVYFLARELGFNVHLYDGSMDEWANRVELPMEKTE